MSTKLLATGISASDFELYAPLDQRLRLSELKGKRIVLAFYPADWSPVWEPEEYVQ